LIAFQDTLHYSVIREKKNEQRGTITLKRYNAWLLAAAWTSIVTVSLVWNMYQVKQQCLELSRIQARSTYDKDITYRRWNATHGGVYAPVTEETSPNVYLEHIEERDIKTPSGKQLTLLNPAYMTRQVHELAARERGVRGHITSLNPIRPENAPDPWEIKALEAFERGVTEVSSVENMGGSEYMRLMKPLITEKGCLKCHAHQGYTEGSIRGGISVSVPLAPLKAMTNKPILWFVLWHFILWLIGIVGIFIATHRLSRRESERDRAENELKKYAEQLEVANVRLKEADHVKSVFLATMSHELRTPLNSIIGFTSVILKGLPGPLTDTQKKQLCMVKESADHLLKLINDILDISKLEAGQMSVINEPFDLRKAVEKVVQTVSPLAEKKGLTIVSRLAAEVDWIISDELRVEQIIINLLNNAIKFSNRGEIRISSRVIDGGSPDSRCVEIEVTDQGIGIKPEDMKKLFKSFRQVDAKIARQHEGTGLGLAICKRLVKLLGGDIRAESEWDVGSRFTFSLPLKREER
jgi:hypothetical protein